MQADDAREGIGPNWAAVAWAEALSVAGLVLVVIAVASSVEDCTISLGCDNSSSPSGGALLLLGAIGFLPFTASSFVAARLSGWPSAGWVTAVSLAAGLAALGIGVLLLRALDSSYLPALALALAVQAGIAVRPPSRRAVRARMVVVAVLFLVACAVASESRPSDGTLILLVLVAIPSVGVADAIAGSRGRRRAA
jgi:hypothetical protein